MEQHSFYVPGTSKELYLGPFHMRRLMDYLSRIEELKDFSPKESTELSYDGLRYKRMRWKINLRSEPKVREKLIRILNHIGIPYEESDPERSLGTGGNIALLVIKGRVPSAVSGILKNRRRKPIAEAA